jgi:hypothetical protein
MEEFKMNDREVLFQEYNNLWNEKLIHKQSIRKFHNYLTYITAIGSLALAFHGVSASDFLKVDVDPALKDHILKNAGDIVHLFFIAFAPVVFITLTFPLNDIYHIYVMGHQIGALEKRINSQSSAENLLTWEHVICPVVYGGEKVHLGQRSTKLTNTISLGDILLLAPAIAALCAFSAVISCNYIFMKVGILFATGYILLIAYMLGVVIFLASKVKSYTKAGGPITKLVSAKQKLAGEPGRDKERQIG